MSNEVTLAQRAKWYNESLWGLRSKKSHLHVEEDYVSGIWQVGNCFRNSNPLYGTFPPTTLERLLSMFQDIKPAETLHVFSGALGPGLGTRLDIDPAKHPDVVGDAVNASTLFAGKQFKLVTADPPYEPDDAARYGFAMPNKRLVVRGLAAVVPPGYYLAWMDERPPIYRGEDWRQLGDIMIHLGTNRRIRAWFLFRRTGPGEAQEVAVEDY